jgi:excisionase family DNA binding protein
MKEIIYTTHQVAKLIGCHHTSVINWVKQKRLKAFTTPGGHRRICKKNLLAFIKKYNMRVNAQAVEVTK